MRVFLPLFLFTTAACLCVDPSKVVTTCTAEGFCEMGLTCCADGLCRSSCGAGGGTSGGSGGGIGVTGGGAAGGSAGGVAGCQDDQPCVGNTGAPCRVGVTRCSQGVAACIDGPAGPVGTACGNDLVCRGGQCVSCVPDTRCSTNPNPCVEGEQVCGETPSCRDTTRQRSAGAPCGPGKACTSAGQCITCAEGTACAENPGAPCIEGVIRCGSGAPVCSDGPLAPTGRTCGNGMTCVTGSCLECVVGSACTSNPSSCRQGRIQCGAMAGCFDAESIGAGVPCGPGSVCDGDGGCTLCTAGASCTTNPDPCRRGRTDCSTGVETCVDDALKPAGTSCGNERVCNAMGQCTSCVAGLSCTQNASTCRLGLTSCTTGATVCNDGAPKDAGVACASSDAGVVRCDGRGFCGVCPQGASCTNNPGAPCRAGVVDCTSGGRCIDASPLTAGTSCGPDAVCDGSGSCVSCVAGVSCTSNPSRACKTGVTSCTTGRQTCVDSSERPPGTSCGVNQVCSTAGTCVTCTANLTCTGNPSECRNGITSCATGTSECVDGSPKSAGTSCGSNQACDANGNCGQCMPNAPCTTNPGGACRLGRTDCSTGSARCLDSGNAPAGTTCGAGQVCNATGACIACAAGNLCGQNPGLCQNGVTECSTGALRCVDSGNKAPGTVCGTNQVCNSGGTCVNCAAGTSCNPVNPCFTGAIACGSGAPVCTPGTRRGTGASCGTNLVCNSMDQCVSCTQGAACTTNASAACKLGVTECSSGSAVCADGANKPNGTSCPGGVCNNGSCNPCSAGAACTTNPGSACKNGVTDCSTGTTRCLDGANKANGTSCSGGVCNAGMCNPCTAGASCTTNPNQVCAEGVVSCTTGSPVCTDGTPRVPGTTCPGGVCNGGLCSACTMGAACTTNPTPACKNGIVDCTTGTPRCLDGSNKTNGTSCSGGVCNAGACNPCSAGAGCTTNSNSCQNGVTDCSTGSAICNNGSNKPPGSACAGGVCNAGTCNACTQGASCTPMSSCRTGAVDCSSGGPVCMETGNSPNGSACPGGVCNGGACVACTAGAACTTNTNECTDGVVDCSTGTPTCVNGPAKANLTACTNGRCVNGACCRGCVQNPSTTPTCQAGFSISACGINGTTCKICSSGPKICVGGFRICDTGACGCEF